MQQKNLLVSKMKQGIAIVDYGSQYTQLIARRVRELGVYSEIFAPSSSLDKISSFDIKGVVLSGGPTSVYDSESPKVNSEILSLDVPILGICYGMQTLVNELNGDIERGEKGEYGFAQIKFKGSSPLFKDVKDKLKVWMSHGDRVEGAHKNFRVIAKSDNNIIAAIEHTTKPFYGVQFHPEVTHTQDKNKILSNFLFSISNCNNAWGSGDFIEESVSAIRSSVGDKKVVCGISGGVDSSVMGKLLYMAIGDQCKFIFVDHGLLRKNEAEEVLDSISNGLGLDLSVFDYSDKFFNDLKGVEDPEKKRKIIGKNFIDAFEESTKKMGKFDFLAQGTLYPDVIESGFSGLGKTAKIKSHHNVGGLPSRLKFDLIEPLRDLFKDEVRSIGEMLGIEKSLLLRHPFPGPGLAVRILGEVNRERVAVLQDADSIFIEILKKMGEYDKIWQAFCVLIPINTVGVMGDCRTYEGIIGLRAVVSIDGMTADWYRMPSEVLEQCSSRIVNEVEGVNRVVYDVTSKPPSTIEWE